MANWAVVTSTTNRIADIQPDCWYDIKEMYEVFQVKMTFEMTSRKDTQNGFANQDYVSGFC